MSAPKPYERLAAELGESPANLLPVLERLDVYVVSGEVLGDLLARAMRDTETVGALARDGVAKLMRLVLAGHSGQGEHR